MLLSREAVQTYSQQLAKGPIHIEHPHAAVVELLALTICPYATTDTALVPMKHGALLRQWYLSTKATPNDIAYVLAPSLSVIFTSGSRHPGICSVSFYKLNSKFCELWLENKPIYTEDGELVSELTKIIDTRISRILERRDLDSKADVDACAKAFREMCYQYIKFLFDHVLEK